MTPDITPGTYKNTNTGVEFEVTVDGDEVVLKQGEGEAGVEIRKDASWFSFNTMEATGPTFELVEPASDTSDESDDEAELCVVEDPTCEACQ